jgi:hypothetical protein
MALMDEAPAWAATPHTERSALLRRAIRGDITPYPF